MCCKPMKKEQMGYSMNCNCGCWQMSAHRHFFSRQEEIEMLENHRTELEGELDGVKQKIESLQ